MSVIEDEISVEILQIITPQQAWFYSIVPYNLKGNELEVLTNETFGEKDFSNELSIMLGKEIKIHLIPDEELTRLLSKFYRKESSQKATRSLDPSSNDFLDELIAESKSVGSSDIHLERYEDRSRIRLRIDGQMVERYQIPNANYPSLVNKIKILANLDIAEKRLPQDGRIFFKKNGQQFDIRVSVLPTLHGEKVVMRLLSNDATHIDINQLGFEKQDLTSYLEGAKRPSGILLISGPTGSGKTTTLYATLKLLNKTTRNILTIEDPIEYTLEGINQVQLKEAIGMDFASALRTFLRQDPDIIMVGEIRDVATANMAIRASLTGHLVLSTIHTNSAWGTISRLIDMGIPPFLVSNTLNTSVAQRLVRKLCNHCKKEADFDESLYPRQFKPAREVKKHYLPQGCEHCYQTGYQGRKAIYEVIPIDQELSERIREGKSEVKEELKSRGIKTIAENSFRLFEEGITSLEEIYPLLMS